MLLPKKENQGTGYFFDVTDDQIKEHLTRSPEDIFQWLESTNKFVNLVQTEQEKHKSRMAKII